MADDLVYLSDSASLGGQNRCEEDESHRCARNIQWQKIFLKRIAPLCTFVMDQRERHGGTDTGLFNAFAPTNRADTKRIIDVGGEKVVVQVVSDSRKPPSDMTYDQVTLVLEDPDNDLLAPKTSSSDGFYLVREISAFFHLPNMGSISERLFMDRNRENYKTKGWGVGRWRVWLALEDVDAARKKRKKAEIARLRGSKKNYPVVTPTTDMKRSPSYNQNDIDPIATSKRVRGSDKEPTFSNHQQQPQLSMKVLLPMMQVAFNPPQLLAPTSFKPMSSQPYHYQQFLGLSIQDSQRVLQPQIVMNDVTLMPQLNPRVLPTGMSMQMPNMYQVWLPHSPQVQPMSLKRNMT